VIRSSSAALQYRQRLVALLRATAAAAAAQAAAACTLMLDVLLPEIQKMGRFLEPTAHAGVAGVAGGGTSMGGDQESNSSLRLQLPAQHIFQSDLEEGVYLIAAAAWEGANNTAVAASTQASSGPSTAPASPSPASLPAAGGAVQGRPVAGDLLQWCWSLVFDRTSSYQVRKVVRTSVPPASTTTNNLWSCQQHGDVCGPCAVSR
jgi:hypothetical protein